MPAAGSGSRMQAALPKQYLPLLDRPLIAHTIERLCAHPLVRGVIVGISPQDTHWAGLRRDLARQPKLLGSFAGGATRAETVRNGLKALQAHTEASDWVLVHDAVRPCVRVSDMDKLIKSVGGTSDGGLLALPVSDTVKRADDNGCVRETVARAGLWRALTPQMFRIGRLLDAIERALKSGAEITDEAAAVEAAGGRPRLVMGHADNIKITVPEDLALAELFLRRQEGRA